MRHIKDKTLVDNKMIYSSKKELLEFLNIKENFLYPDFSKKYYTKELKKKSGGIRLIKPPSVNLKKVQRLILDKILYKHKNLECVYGLSKDKGVVANANFHKKNFDKQLVNLDIENFFTNVLKKEVNKVFKSLGFNKENSNILTKICTVEGSLPQGAPTSPYLASLSCIKMDKEIYNYCRKQKFTYTRYFDDISISGMNINDKNIVDIEKIVNKNKFNLNKTKTTFYEADLDKIINGVFISKNGLSVTNKYKDEVKSLYINYLKDPCVHNKKAYKGKLSFYLHINKKEAVDFINKISYLTGIGPV